MDSNGSGQTRLTNSPANDNFPACSPDGWTIAFLRETTGGFLINLMDRDGTNLRTIPDVLSDSSAISWSPRGDRIVFVQDDRLRTVKIDGTENTLLSTGAVSDSSPSWSRDGGWIAFTRWSGIAGPNGVLKMRPDATDTTVVALHNFLYASFEDPSWSPNGTRILFAYPNQGDIAFNDSIAFVENTQILPVIVAEAGTPFRAGPKYSPDGQDLIWYQSSPNSFYRFEIATPDRVLTETQSTSSNFRPDWLPSRSFTAISGRVTTPGGLGLRNATVTLTDEHGSRRIQTTGSFGLYEFANIQPGRQYTVSIASKRYRFQARSITPSDSVAGLDFTGLE